MCGSPYPTQPHTKNLAFRFIVWDCLKIISLSSFFCCFGAWGGTMNTEMIKREVIFPKLNNAGGDLSQRWFVYFSVINPATGRMQAFRKYDGFATLATEEDRKKHASKVIRKWKSKLMNGWNPFFEQDKVKYASLIRYETDARRGRNIVDSTRNFEYYSSRYLSFVKNILKREPSTYTSYKSKLRIYGQFLSKKGIDKVNVRFYNQDTIKDFNEFLIKERGLDGKSLNDYNETLNRFWKHLIKEEKLTVENPVTGMRRYKEIAVHHMAFNEHHINTLKNAIQPNDPILWLKLKTLYSTLLRPNELRHLQMKHFSWSDGTILLPAELAKNDRARLITLPDYLYKELLYLGYDKYPGDYFFSTIGQEPGPQKTSKNHLYNKFKHYLMLLQFPKGYTLYSWKHTGVQGMKRNGVDNMFIKAQLGHASYDQMLPYIEELMTQGNDDIRKKVIGF